MVTNRIMEPTITSFSISIKIPASRSIRIIQNTDICLWEKAFESWRRFAETSTIKNDYDRCRATLKWAIECNAVLDKITNGIDANGKTIEFTFSFRDINSLMRFVNFLEVNVKSK